MQKSAAFKKDITFDNSIFEINSISLEHEVDVQKDCLISGKFIISGDYKLTSSSIHLDSFEYKLPFNINVDKKYDIDDAKVDISDFYYEVVNGKVLSVNIELTIDGILEKEEEVVEEVRETLTEEVEEEVFEEEIDRCVEEDAVKSLFDNLDDNEIYVTYKIHIVTENDTIESIMSDYGITKEMLENYNDISSVKIGDKLIVPANEN